MSDFYRRLDERQIAERNARIFRDRPDNLHDYQGCANDPTIHFQVPEDILADWIQIPEDLLVDWKTLNEPYVRPEKLEWAIDREKNLMQFALKLIARVARAEAPISEAEWNGDYTYMGMRSRETVNALRAKRSKH